MDRIFSPWRSKYIESFKSKEPKSGCIFCDALTANEDEDRLVVQRSHHAYIIMNLYPYNSGHLLIVPNRHTADYPSLTTEELADCQSLLQRSQTALTELCSPHGFNIGMNLGRAAGAGIEEHLHWHIVPRWNGDTNFMPTVADIKLVSEDMHTQWKRLRDLLA
jgi:ATP adenylyltransferase